MSLTTIAMCWNQRSLLRASAGTGRALPAEVLDELDPLGAESHRDDANPCPGHAQQALDLRSRRLDVRHLLEEEHGRVEVDRAVHVFDRDGDAADGPRGRGVDRGARS